MNSIFLTLTILGISAQGITTKYYEQKTKGKASYWFNVISRFSALTFFLVIAGNLTFDWGIVPYSIAFGFFYGLGAIFNYLSIANGPLSLTSLITSYSLMLPTAYGLIFLQDPVSKGFIPGLLLLLISLFLINQKSQSDGEPISLKWIIFVALSFIGNGGCSIAQSMQQKAFAGAYKNEFMIVALIFVVVVIAILSLCTERKNIVSCTKKGWWLAAICGVANGIVNLLVMILQGKMPVSVLFPMVSAGGLVLTFFLSKYLYKEKLSKRQLTGFCLGVASVIFLNL